MNRPQFLRIPCGQTLGHGISCQEDYLCTQCSYIEELEANLEFEKDSYKEILRHKRIFAKRAKERFKRIEELEAMLPDWSTAPEWANWYITNRNGKIHVWTEDMRLLTSTAQPPVPSTAICSSMSEFKEKK